MTEHKIFQPDILLRDYINSSWCENIKTIEGKMPISQFLKSKGILALEVIPQLGKDWFGFGLPVNKNWEAENFTSPMFLNFAAYSEGKVSLSIMFQDSKQKNSAPIPVTIEETNSNHVWSNIRLECPSQDIRMVLFTGSSKSPDFVIKDIILKSL